MDINKLIIGEKYKWKTICELTNIPYVKGNSKVKQMKIFESLCKFTKDGTWFTIEEIYKTPKLVSDKRVNREVPNSIDNLMRSAIMYKVVNSEDGFYCGGINNWLLEIGIVNSGFVALNQRYFKRQYDDNEEEKISLMDRDFITLEYSSLRSHFIGALEKIKKTKLADYFITCRIGYSENKIVKWTRDLEEDELKLLYAEKNKLYKRFGILNEIDLLYGNEKLGIERDVDLYNDFKRELRYILKENFEGANFEYTAYKVILKNTSEMAFKLIEETFFKNYDLAFLQNSIYVKRKKCAEKRQEDAQKKYTKIEGKGDFFEKTNEMYVNSLNLNKVEMNKINGLYVELWDAIYKELMMIN